MHSKGEVEAGCLIDAEVVGVLQQLILDNLRTDAHILLLIDYLTLQILQLWLPGQCQREIQVSLTTLLKTAPLCLLVLLSVVALLSYHQRHVKAVLSQVHCLGSIVEFQFVVCPVLQFHEQNLRFVLCQRRCIMWTVSVSERHHHSICLYVYSEYAGCLVNLFGVCL